MDQQISGENLTLDNCDREPIHIPGTIQPFGTLLAGHNTLKDIAYAAANLGDVLGMRPETALGSAFDEVLPGKLVHDIRNVLAYPTSRTQRERVGSYTINDRALDVYAHCNDAVQAIVEFEPAAPREDAPHQAPIERARLFLAQASSQPTIQRFLRVAVVGLRDLTGFDRVKAYRYAADGSGEVVAEARDWAAESFLGLRYPAWDVPAQARALQVRNPVRMISDVHQEPIEVIAHQGDIPPLDMSLAHLRGISPIHVQYLINMGVGATLTIGLVVDGALWGMFSCHHLSPRIVRSDLRIAVELFGQMVSLLIKERLEKEQRDAKLKAGNARQRILAETDAEKDLLHAFPSVADIAGELVQCDGIAVLREDKLQTSGSVPSAEAIRAIGDRLPEDENLLEATESLPQDGWHAPGGGPVSDPLGDSLVDNAPDLGDTAGCMIIRATAAYPLQLMFFRDEITRSVKWAGKPEKEIADGPFGPRITPRGSFAAYVEEQSGRCETWTAFDLVCAREIQVLLTQITAKSEREQLSRHKDMVTHQRQQDLMIAELNHRVKNILALIRSLSRQAKDSSASLESYALALEQRIAALAAAHDLAVSESMRGVSLRGALDTELGPYLRADNAQAVLSGPTIGLRPDVAPMIALVFHEIITNAAKYGALSTADGIVQARWEVNEDGLAFHWRELGGPLVQPPERNGFGRSLIEKAIPYEFDGTVNLEYDPAGVKLDFTLPAALLVDLEDDPVAEAKPQIGEIKRIASGKTALLVEDNIVLAMDMVDSITRLGADRIETAGTVETALNEIRTNDFDFAILDMNLRGVVVFDVATKLKEDGVPFLFVTGYGSAMDMPSSLENVPILTKPIDEGALQQGLEAILSA